MPRPTDDFLGLPVAARLSGIGFARLLRLARTHVIPARLDGNGRWWISRAGLDAYRRQQRQEQRAQERVA